MDAAREGDRGNTIGGDAQLYGPTVQAGSVRGGIHLHAAAADGAPPPTPRQLLPVPSHFTGRRDDLTALATLLGGDEDRPLIVVSGPAGIGKTTLVSRWLRDLQPDFPDGQLYADLRGHSVGDPARPAEILGHFLRALGARSVPTDPAELASLWRSRSAGLRIAVVLDNALTAAQVKPLLTSGPDTLVVVTSRRRLTGLRLDGARFHALGVLGPAAGVELLTRGIGSERVVEEPASAQQVVALCAGLPLALCLASARLASRPRQPLRTLARALTQEAGRLAALDAAGEGETTVRKALDASYAVLSTESALLYRRLGVLPVRTFDVWTAAAVCAESLEWAERRLDELIEANLVEDIGPDTCRFHDLVRIHARDRAVADDTGAAREEALRRVCDWYLRTATEAQRRLTPAQFTLRSAYSPTSQPGTGPESEPLPLPYADDVGALGWLDAHRMNLMAAVRTSAERGWYATAWQLVDALWPLFLRLRHYDLWIEAHEIGRDAARRADDKDGERQMLNSGAIGLSAAGRTDDAAEWYTASLRAAREAGDVRDEGQALLGLGSCHREAGRPDEAASYLHRAIEVWEGCGYPRGAALARIVLGEIALADSDHADALAHFGRAREGLLAVNDPHDAARALAFLGRARAAAGAFAAGRAELEEALAVFTSSGAAHWQARTLEMLGDSALEHGEDSGTGADGGTGDHHSRALALYDTTSPADAHRLRLSLRSRGTG
ncbi:tetratricopeptide repeat protein [Streptomyces sp. JV176]|uniref:ATP-binding protein n=1 Tax=Streptomyces sp. JV176 TaxID=858630 RepID=UPI002E781498|nr:tetratricopeptide repeat protein [Streptomyces sp. JV176]MEE1799985.1 tetratricopeptide repeat protein [Streptomyces sp. JV176]